MADRLRAALEEGGVSIRSLAFTLAGDGAPQARVESVRRTIGKWLSGSARPDAKNAARLAELFGKPADYFASNGGPRVTTAEFLAQVQQLAQDVARLQERLDALERRQGQRE